MKMVASGSRSETTFDELFGGVPSYHPPAENQEFGSFHLSDHLSCVKSNRGGVKKASRRVRAYTEHINVRQEVPSCRIQMLGNRSKYSSSSFLPPSPLPSTFSDSMNSIRSIHLTIL